MYDLLLCWWSRVQLEALGGPAYCYRTSTWPPKRTPAGTWVARDDLVRLRLFPVAVPAIPQVEDGDVDVHADTGLICAPQGRDVGAG